MHVCIGDASRIVIFPPELAGLRVVEVLAGSQCLLDRLRRVEADVLAVIHHVHVLSPCLVVLALGLAVEYRLYRAILLEFSLAVEGLSRGLGLASLQFDYLPFEQSGDLLRGEAFTAPYRELEAATGHLLPSPVLLRLALVRGAGVVGLAALLALLLNYISTADGALAHRRDARADVGGVLMALEDLDDALLQGVHIRLALGDVLLDEPPAGSHVSSANLGRQEMVEGASLLRGADFALHVLKVPALLQLLDD